MAAIDEWLLVTLEGVAADYREIPPCPRLRRYVECYWAQSPIDEAGEHPVLPDGCIDILFTRIGAEPIGLMTVGLMTTPRNAASTTGQSFFGVRFRPGMASAFIPGAQLLTDEIRPLEDLSSGIARQAADQLAESRSLEEMAGVVEGLLRPLNPPDVGARILWLLATSEASLDELIAQSGLSVRHFRRLCLERAGVSPKYLSRILRFRRAAEKMATLGGQPSWADFAVACGYYDQAHFIREFQEFAGCTPGRFLQFRGRGLD